MTFQLWRNFKASPQDRIEQHSVKQTVETPAFSLAEKIVEMLVTQMQEKTRRVANTHVRRVVNTVEVEIPQFGAETGENPFAKVKGLITEWICRLQEETSSETSKSTEKEEDLEADTGKHSPKLEAAVSRSTVLDGEISTLQLGLLMDIMRADERQTCAKAKADRMGETTVAGKGDRETVVRGVVPNIGIDSFIDDLSSVDSKGLPHQDCEVPMIQTVQKTMDVPQLQFLNKVDGTPTDIEDSGGSTDPGRGEDS